MKIALLSEKYTPDIGGLAISAARLGRLLSSAGHSVRVFAPTGSLSPAERRTFLGEGATVNRFGAHKRVDDTLLDWFELIVEEHKREPFDLVHAYFLTQAGFVATYSGKYLGLPSVVSIRGNDIERAAFDPARFSHVMYALQNASAVTTNASELAKTGKVLIGRDIVLIPNGIEAEHFSPLPRNEALAESLGLTGPVIGFVGELREKKGLATLLSAYAQVLRELRSTLLVVGEVRVGEDRQTFDELSGAIRNARIVVTGHISPRELPDYYALMDVFVHPSLRDGLPNALLEAMACEKAIIATPVGGIPDALTDRENGRLVPVRDADSLAKTIARLLADEALARAYGSAARRTAQEKFTMQAELEGNLNLYKSLGLPL
jgi:glycosyltransferase involved in cell wall biosynthesis